MDFVNNNEANLLDIATSLPTTTNSIPFLRCCYYDICIFDRSCIWSIVSCKFHQFKAHRWCQTSTPVKHSFFNKRFHWSYVDNLGARMFSKSPPHSKLSSNSFTTTSW